jgi:hypothetical protein
MSTGYDFLDQLRDDLVALPVGVSRRPMSRLALISGSGVAVACVGVALLILARGGSSTVPTASAATFLNKAASRALDTPAAVLGPGQFYYEKYRGTNVEGEQIPGASGTSEEWMGLTRGRLVFNGFEQAEFRATAGHPFTTSFGNRQLTYTQLLSLPTDSGRLAAIVHRASLPNGQISVSESQYRTIFQLLSGSPWPIPPPLRAALLHVAATIPGLTLNDAARDCAGRAAIAVTLTTRGVDDDKPVRMRLEMLFDPATNLYLGNRGTVVGQPHPFECVALINSGIVNSMTQRP